MDANDQDKSTQDTKTQSASTAKNELKPRPIDPKATVDLQKLDYAEDSGPVRYIHTKDRDA
jgi:hypothetical protein